MANNYLRYKYFLVTRDAYTALYTQIKNILSTNTLRSSVIMYLSEPIAAELPSITTLRSAADVATLLPVKMESTSELEGMLKLTILGGVHTNVESKSELEGNVETHFAQGVNTTSEMPSRLSVFGGVWVRPRLWYGGMNIEHFVPVLSRAYVRQPINTGIEDVNILVQEITMPIKLSEALSAKVSSFTANNLCSEIDIGTAINSESQTHTIVIVKPIIKQDSTVKSSALSSSSCILTCGFEILKYTILSEMDSDILSDYDNLTLSEIDFIRI